MLAATTATSTAAAARGCRSSCPNSTSLADAPAERGTHQATRCRCAAHCERQRLLPAQQEQCPTHAQAAAVGCSQQQQQQQSQSRRAQAAAAGVAGGVAFSSKPKLKATTRQQQQWWPGRRPKQPLTAAAAAAQPPGGIHEGHARCACWGEGGGMWVLVCMSSKGEHSARGGGSLCVAMVPRVSCSHPPPQPAPTRRQMDTQLAP